jgi:hypothetical protein
MSSAFLVIASWAVVFQPSKVEIFPEAVVFQPSKVEI